ncbi:MAG: hypothetical protein ACOCZW_02255 [Bacteroidota bacterium]
MDGIPQNFHYDPSDQKLKWDALENAEEYNVVSGYIGEGYDMDVNTSETEQEDNNSGRRRSKIRAKIGNKWYDWTAEIQYTVN